MKVIGNAKGKAPKGWCLMKNAKTGFFYVGYDGDWPIHGGYEEVLHKVKVFKDELAAQGDRPVVLPEVPCPGYLDFRIDRKTLPQETQDAYSAYEAYSNSVYLADQWDKLEEKTHVVPFDHMPLFEAELRFVGYTRGRSSVTMKFEAENGQIIEFGPSGIDGLIQGIIDGKCETCELTGKYEEETWDEIKQEYICTMIPRGKGIKARFKFAKKGQNTYAELSE